MGKFTPITLWIFWITAIPVFSQTGPGGVDKTDGSGNLSLWLNAGTITGISNGADFSGTWADQSGNGYNASILNNAPSYTTTGGGNSQPSLAFDKSNTESMTVTGNSEILPTNEITVFLIGNYENSSDAWGGFLFAADDDAWNDGWGIAEENNTGNLNIWVDDYHDGGCTQSAGADYGTNHIWTLVFNTTDNMVYGYKSENTVCTDAFNGPIGYDTGGNNDLLIGKALSPTYLTGDISEILVYNTALNSAQRIIVSNYLAAKYAISLTNNDVYDMDNAGNGNYDFEVAGIGRVDASNIHNDAQGTGKLRILNPTNLGNNEFLFWGHDNGDIRALEDSDVPPGINSRSSRVWRVSEANASGTAVDVGSIDMHFDLDGLGAVTASDLVLLVDADNDGAFADETPISGASLIGGTIYGWTGVTAIADNLRFTIGTSNSVQTPLPVQLSHFNAVAESQKVNIAWITAAETSGLLFNIQRSDGNATWESITQLYADGSGEYSSVDLNPLPGRSFYRIRTTDSHGVVEYSDVVEVWMNGSSKPSLILYPNPAKNQVILDSFSGNENEIKIFNSIHQDLTSLIQTESNSNRQVKINIDLLPSGLYFIQTTYGSGKMVKE